MFKKFIVIILSIVLLSACGGGAPVPTTEITATMTDFAYEPASITVPAGQAIVLNLVNNGNIEHDFVVETIDVSLVSAEGNVGGHHMSGDHADYDLHVSVEPGGTSVLRFTANQAGTYKIFCSVEGHEEAGMVAELIVVSE